MRHPFFSLLLVFVVVGCEEEPEPIETHCDEIETNEDDVVVASVMEEQNYSFESTMTITSNTIRANGDFVIDWSELSSDMVGHDVDPLADIDMVQVMLWRISEEELAYKLNRDLWALSDLVGLALVYTDNAMTSVNYLDLQAPGGGSIEEELLSFADPSVYPPDEYSYSVMVSTGLIMGKNARMLALVNLDTEATNTEVRVTSESTQLEYSADLSSLRRLPVPAGSAEILVDWTDSIALNALGAEFVPQSITEAMVAHYPLLAASDLEAEFLDMELIAGDLWRGGIMFGTSVTLSELENDAGVPFSSVDSDGTWVLALFCSDCSNPAPWFMTILESCP